MLLAWSLWRPARSRAKIWMIAGMFVWLRLGLVAAVVLTFLAWLDGHGDVAKGVGQCWPFAIAGVAVWAAQRGLAQVVARSHLREGERSVVPG